MRLLLLTDIPPSENLTAGLVLADIVRGLPAGSVACFCALNTHLKPVLPSDLHAMPIGVTPKPVESGVQIGRSVLLSRLATIVREAKRRTIDSRRIAREAIEFARAHKCDAVWAVLQGQTMAEIAAPVARAIGAPLYTMVWDPLSWWLREHQVDRLSRHLAHRAFAGALRASRACAVASPEMGKAYEKDFGCRTVPVIAGLDPLVAAPPARTFINSQELVIGMAGQFYARQEWDQLLTALHHSKWRVGRRRVRIKVFSQEPPPGELPAELVQYMGYRPRDEVAQELSREADVLYCPYPFAPHMEEVARLSFPSKLAMYLACGRPVLFHGPAYSAPYRYLAARNAGLLCGGLEAPAVHNALAWLVEEQGLYERLARAGSQAFNEDFTLSRMHQSFRHFLGAGADALAAPAGADQIRRGRVQDALTCGASLRVSEGANDNGGNSAAGTRPQSMSFRQQERVELPLGAAQVEDERNKVRPDAVVARCSGIGPSAFPAESTSSESVGGSISMGSAVGHTMEDSQKQGAAYVLQAELNRSAAELDRVRAELVAARMLDERLAVAQREVQRMETALADAAEEVARLRRDLDERDPQPLLLEIARLEGALSTARTDQAALRDEAATLREALTHARADQGAAEERLILRKQVELLQQEATLRRETDALRLEFAVAQAVHAGALESTVLRGKAETESLRLELAVVQASQAGILETQAQRSRAEVVSLEAALAAKVRDVETLRDNITTLTAEVAQAHAGMAEARALKHELIAAVETATLQAEQRTAGRLSLVGADIQTVKRVATRQAVGEGHGAEGLRAIYLDLLEASICGVLSGDPNNDRWSQKDFDQDRRSLGRDWPKTAQSMIGAARLRNIRVLLEEVISAGVEGDVLEAGVWRGGACIYMRGILMAHGDETRDVWVADSFQGLPPPDARYPKDEGDRHHIYEELAVSVDEVRSNFARYGLLDEKVRFLVGWFADTLPAAPVKKLSILRLDGDMYSSTLETLEALYDKVSDDGFVIVDDYILKPCRAAVDEFRERRGITAELVEVDGAAVYWRKVRSQARSPDALRPAVKKSAVSQLS